MSCRVLYLVGQLREGGLERQLYLLLEGMDRGKFRPEVVVWQFQNYDPYVARIRALGVPLHWFPPTHSGFAKLTAFREIVCKVNPEVVHSYTMYTNFAAWWATRGTKAIAIGSERGDFTFSKKEAGIVLGRVSARWPRIQIFNSYAAAQNANGGLHRFFVPKEIFVVRNGLDFFRFRKVPIAMQGPARLLGVGSLIPLKRWDRLLKGAQELKRRGLDFLIRIVGDGPLRQSLIQQAKVRGIAGLVEFIGYSSDIPSLLADTTFLVHPSDSEGCPNVVMEAMACGRPVVATDAGDVPHLVEDGETGYVIRRGDDEGLVRRMATLITNRDLCLRMSEAGRLRAEREFGMDRFISETMGIYRTIGLAAKN